MGRVSLPRYLVKLVTVAEAEGGEEEIEGKLIGGRYEKQLLYITTLAY